MCGTEWITPTIKQTWTMSAVILLAAGQGMVLGHTAVLLPALQRPDSPIKIDLASASSLASCVGLALILGYIVAAYTMSTFGRKKAFLLSVLPGFIGWLSIYLAHNFTTLYAGRILCGATTGAVTTLGSVILGEYTSPRLRGMFLTLKTTSVCFGGGLIHALGSYVQWRTVAVLALVPHVAAFLIACSWPESPDWLIWKKRYRDAELAFVWLRGTSEESQKEFQEIIKSQNENISKPARLGIKNYISELFRKFTRRDFLQPTFIMMISFILVEVSGRHYFQAYAVQIVSEITGSNSNLFYYLLCIDIIITISSTCASFIIKFVKRRTLLLCTGTAAIFFLVVASLCLFLTSHGVIPNYPLISLSFLSIFFIFSNLGCCPIPFILLGELFPLEHRGVGLAISGLILSFALAATVKMTPYLLVATKVHGAFAIFALTMTVSLLILYFVLPETKDKTLVEIEHNFKRRGASKEIQGDQTELTAIMGIQKS